MQIKLKFRAMSILMAGLQEKQMWAVCQMGTGNEVPSSVTKDDLTCIIAFLFKQLNWIDEESPGQPSILTTVESSTLVDAQNSENHAQDDLVEQLTFQPGKKDDKRPAKGDGVKNSVKCGGW